MEASKLVSSLLPGQLPTQVDKKLLHTGKGVFPSYEDGTKIHFHFETRVKGTDTVIDSTKATGKPMELLLGKKFKLEIWEAMLKTMSVGEVAKFTVPRIFVVHYPMVSKALRDAREGKKDREHHCCGMMTQGCGYTDLDDLMKSPKDLEFTFELLDVKGLGEYDRETWQLSPEELLDSIPRLRDEGNKLFNSNDIEKAKKKYYDAIAILEQLGLKEKPGSEESDELDGKKVPLLLNYALCLMKDKNYYEAIQHLSTVVKIQKDCVKALFRRGQCHSSVGNVEEATKDFNLALELDPTLHTRIAEELKNLAKFVKERDQEDKVAFQKMFA